MDGIEKQLNRLLECTEEICRKLNNIEGIRIARECRKEIMFVFNNAVKQQQKLERILGEEERRVTAEGLLCVLFSLIHHVLLDIDGRYTRRGA